MKNVSLDIIRACEASAISAAKLIGSGNKLEIDRVSVEAMRERLNNINFACRVVISEGEKDSSYYMPEGEILGIKGREYAQITSAASVGDFENKEKIRPYTYDISLDSTDGTTQVGISGTEAISVLTISNENTMYKPKTFYMNKLAYGQEIKAKVKLDINDPIERTVELAAFALGKKIDNMMICLLNRPRHNDAISRLRAMNVRLKLIQDCDVSGALCACLPDQPADLYYGIGGSPEAVLACGFIKCLRGGFQVQEVSNDFKITGDTLNEEQLINGECVAVATGILDGSVLHGVRFTTSGCITNSVFMRSKSGTIRWLKTFHNHEI